MIATHVWVPKFEPMNHSRQTNSGREANAAKSETWKIAGIGLHGLFLLLGTDYTQVGL